MNQLINLFVDITKAADPVPTPVPAPTPPAITIQGISFAKGTGIGSLQTAIGNIITLIFIMAGTTALIWFVISGIMYITSGGNPEAAKKGSQGLLYATIGIIVVALSYFLVTAIASWAANGTLRPTP